MAGFDKEQLCLLYDDNESKMAYVFIPTDEGNMQVLCHEKQ